MDKDSNQYSFSDYQLKEVQCRLMLSDGQTLYSDEPISSPNDAVRIMGDMLKTLDREVCCVVNLDNKLRPIDFNIVSVGTINRSMVPVSNVYKSAILSNAAGVIMLHNHPSGEISPSNEDITLTKRIIEAGKLMDIPVYDHVIIGAGNPEYYSFRRDRPELFEGNIDVKELQKLLDNSVSERKTEYSTTDKKSVRERVEDLTTSLEQGVRNLRNGERFKDFLRMQARFPNYSYNNCMLIAAQSKGTATQVMSYTGWKAIGRYPVAGSKAYRILCPCPYQTTVEIEKTNSQGVTETENVAVTRMGFKIGNVFDVAQTDGRPMPEIATRLQGTVKDYDQLMKAIISVSPVPIAFEPIMRSANGYYSPAEKKIVVDESLSEKHKVHTALHEIGHAVLDIKGLDDGKSRAARETEAEAISFVVLNRLLREQITAEEAGQYSFGYLASWGDEQLAEFKECLSVIQQTSRELIDSIEDKLTEMRSEEMKQLNNDALNVKADSSHTYGGQSNSFGVHM